MALHAGKCPLLWQHLMAQPLVGDGFDKLIGAAIGHIGSVHTLTGSPVPIPVLPVSLPQFGGDQVLIDPVADLFPADFFKRVDLGVWILTITLRYGQLGHSSLVNSITQQITTH